MDNWGQGTYTPYVSRLYRRAIGVPRQPMATMAHLPIKRSQKDVTEDWRDHTALRCTMLGRQAFALHYAACFQHAANQAQNATIRHARGNEGKELFVVRGPKKMAPPGNLWVRDGGLAAGDRGSQGCIGASFPVCWDSRPRPVPTYLGGNDAPYHGTESVHQVQAVCV